MNRNLIVNWQKFALLIVALVALFGLVVVGRVEWADVSAPVGLIIGYGTANGIGAAKGQTATPLFRPSDGHAMLVADDGHGHAVEVDLGEVSPKSGPAGSTIREPGA